MEHRQVLLNRINHQRSEVLNMIYKKIKCGNATVMFDDDCIKEPYEVVKKRNEATLARCVAIRDEKRLRKALEKCEEEKRTTKNTTSIGA